MKSRLILLVLLIACFSCGTNNKPDSDAQKEKIIGEVKEVVSTIIKGAEEANSDMIIETCLDSPDFIASFNGNSSDYKQFVDAVKPVFSTLINQKGTIRDEEYAILDNSTVLYTANSRWLMNFKDGHAILQDPWTMQYLFKKIDNKWKVISVNESGVEQSVINTEIPNPLNQIDLMKQFLGSWKCEYAKDTTIYYNAKLYGNGIEGYGKIISKGKTIVEGKQLMGYDKKTDKLIQSQMFMGRDIETYVYYFTSDKKYIIIPFRNISNPDNAPWKCEGEFTSPDIFVETTLEINRPPQTVTFTRVK